MKTQRKHWCLLVTTQALIGKANDTVKVIGDHVTISDKKGKVFYDASGFSNIAVLQAMTNANYPGLSYSSVGGHPEIKETFMLSGGDVAVIGENGILASVNSAGTPLYLNADGLQTGNGGYFSWKNLTSPAYWMHNFSWLLMSGILIGFFILMALAQIARKRSKNK